MIEVTSSPHHIGIWRESGSIVEKLLCSTGRPVSQSLRQTAIHKTDGGPEKTHNWTHMRPVLKIAVREGFVYRFEETRELQIPIYSATQSACHHIDQPAEQQHQQQLYSAAAIYVYFYTPFLAQRSASTDFTASGRGATPREEMTSAKGVQRVSPSS